MGLRNEGAQMKCTDGQGRACAKEATLRIYNPEGKAVPGCWMCEQHAQAVVSEYKAKLGQEWTAKPVQLIQCPECGAHNHGAAYCESLG